MANNRREFCFDALKAFAIYLVLWGHIIQYCGVKELQQDVVGQIIYSFHMPLFMMVAGLFSVKSMSMKFVYLLKKKGKQLLLPIIGGCLMLMPITYFLSYFIGFGCLITHYWFLKSLFCCYIILWLGLHISALVLKSKPDTYIVYMGGGIGLIISVFVDVYNVDIMFPSFLLGYYLSHYKSKILHRSTSLICISLFTYFVTLYLYHNVLTGAVASLCRVIMGLSGALFWFMLFVMVVRRSDTHNKITSFIGYVGRNTLGIYIIQTILLETIIAHYWAFDITNTLLFSLFIAPLMSAVLVCIIMLIINILERTRLTAILFLGKG